MPPGQFQFSITAASAEKVLPNVAQGLSVKFEVDFNVAKSNNRLWKQFLMTTGTSITAIEIAVTGASLNLNSLRKDSVVSLVVKPMQPFKIGSVLSCSGMSVTLSNVAPLLTASSGTCAVKVATFPSMDATMSLTYDQQNWMLQGELLKPYVVGKDWATASISGSLRLNIEHAKKSVVEFGVNGIVRVNARDFKVQADILNRKFVVSTGAIGVTDLVRSTFNINPP